MFILRMIVSSVEQLVESRFLTPMVLQSLEQLTTILTSLESRILVLQIMFSRTLVLPMDLVPVQQHYSRQRFVMIL